MKIRRFEAENANTALAMVKKEMGSSAVILATRTLTDKRERDSSGLIKNLGRTGRPRVEVVAAMDYDLDDLTASPEAAMVQEENLSASLRPLQNEFQETKIPLRRHSAVHDTEQHFATLLSKQPQPAARAMGRRAIDVSTQRPDPGQVARWRHTIIDQIKIKPFKIDATGNGPTAIALVGATGVGKTTTIAKLAAWFSLRERKKVALISMDCYRIGATDQLRTYGRIMHLPCEVALDQEDLRQAILRHNDKDIILIDTAGKSPYDRSHVSELAQWFAPCQTIKPYLVLSATSQRENLTKVMKNYDQLGLNGLLITKLDETQSYAALCQELSTSSSPVSGLCMGQRVPEDFQMASKAFLKKLFNQGWSALPEEFGFMTQGGVA